MSRVRIVLTTSVALLFAVAACEESALAPEATTSQAPTLQQSVSTGADFVDFVTEGETFPCFVGPEPEDLRMQGLVDLVFGEVEHVMLMTVTIVEPISPEHSRGAQVQITSHTNEVFAEGTDPDELPPPAFLGPCHDADDLGEVVGTLVTADRAVASPTPEPLVFKLYSRAFPQEGDGIFEGVQSTPALNLVNGKLEFGVVEIAPGVEELLPVRVSWDEDSSSLRFD